MLRGPRRATCLAALFDMVETDVQCGVPSVPQPATPVIHLFFLARAYSGASRKRRGTMRDMGRDGLAGRALSLLE
jgi:hypothetical protein